jgi:quinohemoprotein amine dehydrogenase
MSMRRSALDFLIVLALVLCAGSLAARQAQPSGQKPATAGTRDEGIPVTSQLVIDKCGACHAPDAQKRMTRISFRRSSPEGWQQTVRRMAGLHGLPLEPDEARAIVRYLANNHGLAPDEARPAAFEVERRMIDYGYRDRATEEVCTKCHSMGRVLLERRTKEEWDLLVAMHRGFFYHADSQAFRRGGPAPTEPDAEGRPPDTRHPMDRALAHLTRTFPLTTPEWTEWSANLRPPRIDGRWALTGYQPGRGRVFGEVTITPAGSSGEDFTTATRLFYARGSAQTLRTGRAIVYTGFQWRGRSTEPADANPFREVMHVDRDWKTMTGRWFTGAHDEIGMDVTLRRIGSDPMVLGVEPSAVRAGGAAQAIRIYGHNFPPGLAATDLDGGRGVQVTRISSVSPALVAAEVTVAPDAPDGPRDVFVAGSRVPAAFAVYHKVDYIKVEPQAGMARVGGARMPKQLQQFETIAWTNGADGKPGTKDDIALGLADVEWTIEEYTATFDDDDKAFVGTIDRGGLFTPAEDGPNPKRSRNRNNVGDVWAVATLTSFGGAALPSPIRARAHLLVTVPLYMRWEEGR